MEPTRNYAQIRAGILALTISSVALVGVALLFNAPVPPERMLSASLAMATLVVTSMLGCAVGIMELKGGMVMTFRSWDGEPASPVDLAKARIAEENAEEYWLKMTSVNG